MYLVYELLTPINSKCNVPPSEPLSKWFPVLITVILFPKCISKETSPRNYGSLRNENNYIFDFRLEVKWTFVATGVRPFSWSCFA
jgi:hypothetical protein